MSRSNELYLNDILKAIRRINSYISDLTVEDFKADELRMDGVLFNLVTIGEAIKQIPDDLRDREPQIRWREIGRFRDRVVHHYFGLDLDIVWEIVTVHLSPLENYVEQLLHDLKDDELNED